MSDRKIGFLFVCSLIILTVLGCVTVQSNPNAPVIKEINFTDVNTSGSRIELKFQDANGDIEKVFVEVTVNGQRPTDADQMFRSIQWGIVPGTKTGTASFRWSVRHSATRCFNIYMMDAEGNKSNQLYGCMIN